MNKNNLQIGKKYLHIRKTIIDGIEREAERWIKCVGTRRTVRTLQE